MLFVMGEDGRADEKDTVQERPNITKYLKNFGKMHQIQIEGEVEGANGNTYCSATLTRTDCVIEAQDCT